MNNYYLNLANTLVHFSTRVKAGDHVLIEATDVPEEMLLVLMHTVRQKGGIPHIHQYSGRLQGEWIQEGCQQQFAVHSNWQYHRMQQMQVYIGLRGAHNIFEQAGIGKETMQNYMGSMRPVIDQRVDKTRWVVLRWPTPSMAQQCSISTAAFEKFFFDVCCLDYEKLEKNMQPLKALMEGTDQVHIKGPGTDIHFSIKGMPSIVCAGNYNLPDGEILTAPIKNSVEGIVTYNTPTVYTGKAFENIQLSFSRGKITSVKGRNASEIEGILDADDGARYVGEFALGLNPLIHSPMRDILFDEKITGSFHLTPGQAYKEADNGNRSQVHWDLVCIQTDVYGGGEIWFDNNLVRKDGLFVLDALKPLNPDELLQG